VGGQQSRIFNKKKVGWGFPAGKTGIKSLPQSAPTRREMTFGGWRMSAQL
jgi:hypothetical protein